MNSSVDAELSLRERAYDLLERGRRGLASQLFDVFIVILILVSVTVSVISTVPEWHEEHGDTYRMIDRICVAVFIVEYLARLWVAPEHPLMEGMSPSMARLRTAFTPLMIVDFIAILPFFLELLVGVDLTAIRVLRIFRFYRLARYAPAIVTIGRVLAAEWRSLLGASIIFAGLLLLASVSMFYAEGRVQREEFGDIPAAMWWAVVTLSTVGYGDVIPLTPVGKFIGGIVMVLGLMFTALPVGIIATGFAQEIKRRDFVVSFAMVARVPLFADLKAPVIASLVGRLNARKFAPGSIIVSKGDPADEMYFVATGEVEVELEDGRVRLGEGDFFGEIALIKHQTLRTASVYAVRQTDLLVLSVLDFRRLMHDYPELKQAINKTAEQRMESSEQDN
ncbi:MAG: cyclic nucleotide-gated ion channel [Pseudomonadota bacterium]